MKRKMNCGLQQLYQQGGSGKQCLFEGFTLGVYDIEIKHLHDLAGESETRSLVGVRF